MAYAAVPLLGYALKLASDPESWYNTTVASSGSNLVLSSTEGSRLRGYVARPPAGATLLDPPVASLAATGEGTLVTVNHGTRDGNICNAWLPELDMRVTGATVDILLTNESPSLALDHAALVGYDLIPD